MSDIEWHLAHVPLDFTKNPIHAPFHDMVRWCIENVSLNKRDWTFNSVMQISNYWVFGFENEEDAKQWLTQFI